MFLRIKELFIKEFLQMFRDVRMRLVIFVFPMLQMIFYLFAITTDVNNISLGVVDLDQSVVSRDLLERFVSSKYFRIKEVRYAPKDITDLLDRGKVQAVIHFPYGFADNMDNKKVAPLQLILDGTNSNNASIILGYADSIIKSYTSEKYPKNPITLSMSKSPETPFHFSTRSWFNENLESKFFYVPGIVAMMILVLSLLLTSLAIVREKEIGTMEQILVTPIKSLEFILGKTVPYLIVCYFVMTSMLLLGMAIFDVHIVGSWVLLYLLSGIYILGNLGIALFISIYAFTQQQALLTAFFVLMPASLLSGFIFPIRNMPEWVQYLTHLNPMRYYIEIVRGIMIKGVGAGVLWPSILSMSALAIFFLLFSALRLRKTLV